MEKQKQWIRLFQHRSRSDLEENLNGFIRDHENCEINVWTDSDGWWCASVRYNFPESPTYPKPEI